MVPIRHEGKPCTAFMEGWRPECLYAGFAPVFLLELMHENGESATWYLDREFNRIGGSLQQLSVEVRRFVIDRYLDLICNPPQAPSTALSEFDALGALCRINHHTLSEIQEAASLDAEGVANWNAHRSVGVPVGMEPAGKSPLSLTLSKLSMRHMVAKGLWSTGVEYGKQRHASWVHDADLLLCFSRCLEATEGSKAALAALDSTFSAETSPPAEVLAQIGLLRIRLGDSPTGSNLLDRALGMQAFQAEDVYRAFVEAKLSEGDFKSITTRLHAVRNRAGWLLQPEVLAFVLSRLGRALLKLQEIPAAREVLIAAVAASQNVPSGTAQDLEHCVWHSSSPFTEQLPELLQTNVNLFAEYVTSILQREAVLPPLPDGRYSSAVLAAYWIKAGARTMTLNGGSSSEALLNLQLLGLSKTFLEAACGGPHQVASLCAELSPDIPFSGAANLSDRQFDVAGTVILRAKPMLCPFTGTRGLAYDSLDTYVYLYRAEGRICIVVSLDNAMVAYSDCAWFIPEHQLLLCVQGWNVQNPLVLALTRTFDNRELVMEYLKPQVRPVMVSDVALGHLGHYIWNVISGWSTLFELAPVEKIDIIATNRQFQMFGGVKELYPDVTCRAGALIEFNHGYELYQYMLRSKALSVVLLDRHVRTDLADRVIKWCRDRCNPDFLARVDTLKRASNPLLLVTLRLENRAWIEQEDGIPNIINQLATDFPDLTVVLDGLNADIHSLDTHAFMSLEDEMRLAKHIIASCPDVRIENSIGCPLIEGIVWCDTVDAFMAPIGAGLAKYRWITNKPGVAYSNQTFLSPGDAGGHLYDHHRDDLVPMEYVEHTAVTDVETERHGLWFRANFSMPWEAAYKKTHDLLTRLLR